MTQRPVRIASEEDIARLLKHSASAGPLAPAERYPDLQVDSVPRAYRLDEVEVTIEERELEAGGESPSLSFREARTARVADHGTSRRYKVGRGVTHIRPVRIVIAAWAYLLTWIALFGTLVGVPLWMFLTHGHDPTLWMLAPVGFLLLMLAVAVRTVPRSRCTVCMQPMFLNLSCHRNDRAHRFALGNTALSSALVTIFTLRLRCPYCGTKQHMMGRQEDSHRH